MNHKIVVMQVILMLILRGFQRIGIKPGNRMKRLAAFINPNFYKAQAMRLSTYNKPRIISCVDETDDYPGLPRGCKPDLKNFFQL